MTEILVSYVMQLKYVNMYLGQLQWPCLVGVSKFEIVYYHFGRQKNKKYNVCKSDYSKENKLAIGVQLLYL